MKIIRVASLIVLIATIALGTWLFQRRSRSVVWALRDKAEPTGHPVIVWLNPFRDRSTEMVSEFALKAFRDGNIKHIDMALNKVDGGADIIEHELKNSIKKWEIADIEIEGDTAALSYKAVRVGGNNATPINVFLKREGKTWQIVGWESWY